MKLLISPPRLFLLPRSLSLRSLTARRRTMATTTAACITLPRTPLFEALARQPQDKSAIIHSASGKTFSYGSLLADVAAVRGRLLGAAGTEDLNEQRVALLIENGYEYVGVDPFSAPCIPAADSPQ